MKSRLAILGMLVTGLLFSTTGAGLAITGFTDSHSAGVAQYGQEGHHKPGGTVLGEGNSGGGNGSPSTQQPAPAPAPVLQPATQVEVGVGGNSNGQLPFTGFAAIPVLLGGIALLTMGVILRRRSREDDQRS